MAQPDGTSLYTNPVPTEPTTTPEAATPKLRLSQRLMLAVVLIRLLSMTLRYEDRVEPGATPAQLLSGPSIFVMWHRSVISSAYRFRNMNIAMLISNSFDGELIARTSSLLGFCPVRGSSSRGGAAALLRMQQAYGEGHLCAITADGPRGPVYVAKHGAARLANSVGELSPEGQPAGTWVGCFYARPERAWELHSWDRHMIPKPFSRVIITWPAPVPAGKVTTASVQAALDRAVQMAENRS
jgi:lysophospholipid acyltransferase (LPLAT)-like uncharacterized protein